MQTVGREPPLLHQPGEPAAAAVRLLPSVGGNGAELTVAAAGATEAATMGAPPRYARVDDYLKQVMLLSRLCDTRAARQD